MVIGPGNGAVGPPEVLLDRPKMLLKVWVVKEPRRLRVAESVGGVVLPLLDIMKVVLGVDVLIVFGKVKVVVGGERLRQWPSAALFSVGDVE